MRQQIIGIFLFLVGIALAVLVVISFIIGNAPDFALGYGFVGIVMAAAGIKLVISARKS
ncbi:MAG: hypothetical protein ACFFDI_26485 [Promethearchaeota archaeon]